MTANRLSPQPMRQTPRFVPQAVLCVLLTTAFVACSPTRPPIEDRDDVQVVIQGNAKGLKWMLFAYSAGTEPCFAVVVAGEEVLDRCAPVADTEPFAEVFGMNGVPYVAGMVAVGPEQVALEYTVAGLGPKSTSVTIDVVPRKGLAGYFISEFERGAQIVGVRAR